MRKRTLARELALQIAYQLDVRGDEVRGNLDELLAAASTDPEIIGFARELVEGCWTLRAEIDGKIESVARNWELRRMAVIDRNILRLASYEILHRQDIPPLVTINEAIELAKKFSTKKSGQFVNGILDNLRLRCAPPEKQKNDERKPAPSDPATEAPA